MTDIKETVKELAALWPALAAALARDTAAPDGGSSHVWAAVQVVNPDVLAATLALHAEVPAAVRHACEDISEPWRHRDLDGCLHQVPRLVGRMHDLGHVSAERQLCWDASSWLHMVKRALGLRKPDVPLPGRPNCPDTETYPERHPYTATLFLAGAEGYLCPGADVPVRWVTTGLIYCASEACGAAWDHEHWTMLGRLLRQAAEAA